MIFFFILSYFIFNYCLLLVSLSFYLVLLFCSQSSIINDTLLYFYSLCFLVHVLCYIRLVLVVCCFLVRWICHFLIINYCYFVQFPNHLLLLCTYTVILLLSFHLIEKSKMRLVVRQVCIIPNPYSGIANVFQFKRHSFTPSLKACDILTISIKK